MIHAILSGAIQLIAVTAALYFAISIADSIAHLPNLHTASPHSPNSSLSPLRSTSPKLYPLN